MGLLQEFLAQHAIERPDSVFIHEKGTSISYAEMDRGSDRIARILKGAGVEQGDGVAIFLPKGAELFQSLFGILKADGFYLPLNLANPPERNLSVLEHARVRFLLTNAEHEIRARELAASLQGVTVVVPTNHGSLSERAEPLRFRNTPEDLAYVLYTSGSTGEPKGVMVSHGNVVNYAQWATEFFEITPDDRLSNHPGIHFDLSVFDIYSAVRAGASLHLVPPSASLFPIQLVDFIHDNQLTIWNAVPSVYSLIVRARALEPSRVSSLRALTFNGEVMPTPTVQDWMKAVPHARFVNQYGPTETTCASLFFEISEPPEDPAIPIPIGTPLANTEAIALSDAGGPVAPGETGELYIGGFGVARGYLNDAPRTEAAFVDHPFLPGRGGRMYRTGDLVRLRADGAFDFVGRRDNQVKIAGHRVELGAVDVALRSLEWVSDAAALAITPAGGADTVLISFVVFADGKAIPQDAELRRHLESVLPPYMIPRRYIPLERMPLNSNGKVDRVALREMVDRAES